MNWKYDQIEELVGIGMNGSKVKVPSVWSTAVKSPQILTLCLVVFIG